MSSTPLPVPQKPSLAEALKVWAKIGVLSFGGPAGQIALMHKELVEGRRWIGEQRFLHALNYCMLLPGPEAQQLAVYIGWLMHRTIGGLIAGLLFVVPGAAVMLGLSVFYVFWRELPLIDAVFLGVKAAVLAVVIEAVIRIGKRALKNTVLIAIAAGAFFAIFFLKLPFPLIVAGAGMIGWIGSAYRPSLFEPPQHKASGPDIVGVVDLMFERGELDHARPSRTKALTALVIWLPVWLAPVGALWLLTGSDSVWTQIATFFSTMAAVTFGGAYAVLAYVAQAAVETFGWMTPGEMIDGLGLAETTPGPLIMVTQFVGFLAALRNPGALDPLLAACLGALLTTWVTFAPCFLWIFVGAPYVEALRGNRAVAASLSAITAAVVGVILNLAAWFGIHVLFREVRTAGFGPDVPVLASIDWRAACLAAAAGFLLLKLRWGMLTVLAVSATLGAAIATVG
jgi:chromate transporter